MKPLFHLSRNSFQEIQEVCQGNKNESQQQKDIKTFPLDEVTKAETSFPVFLKIHPVLMYHSISEDDDDHEYKQPNNEQG